MIDWRRNKKLLLDNSEHLIRALFAENTGDGISSVGYVFEFGRGQLQFDLCANTTRNAKESLADYLAKWPDASADDFRWNSGNFDYPGAISDRFGGFSDEWWDELSRLDKLAEDENHSKIVYDGIVDICCEAMAELAIRGVFGDWSIIDFNISALLDNVEQVKKRDERVKNMIRCIA